MGVRRWEENKPTPSSPSAARPAAPGPPVREGETPVTAEPELAPREDALCRRLRGSRAQFLSGTSEKPGGSGQESRPGSEQRWLPVGPAHACSRRLGGCGLRDADGPGACVLGAARWGGLRVAGRAGACALPARAPPVTMAAAAAGQGRWAARRLRLLLSTLKPGSHVPLAEPVAAFR